jgi:hypothetical protein
MEDEVGCDESLPIFQKFAFILNECKEDSSESESAGERDKELSLKNSSVEIPLKRVESVVDMEPFISKIGKLLVVSYNSS